MTGQTAEQRQGKRKDKSVSAARLRLADWTILLTNVPGAQLTVDETLVLARCRWQIELLWTLWKQEGKLDTWTSAQIVGARVVRRRGGDPCGRPSPYNGGLFCYTALSRPPPAIA